VTVICWSKARNVYYRAPSPEPLKRSASPVDDRRVEAFRLAAAEAIDLMGGPGLERLDRLAHRAAGTLLVPIVLVTVAAGADQVFLSAVGLPEPWASRRRMPLKQAFCRHVIATGMPLVIEDVAAEAEWQATPMAREFRTGAYAGFAIRGPDDQPIGSFCAIDVRPRIWPAPDLAVLESLADAAGSEIALLVSNLDLQTRAADLHHVLNNSNDLVRTVEVLPTGRFRAVFSSSNTQDILGGRLGGDPDIDVNDTLFDMVHVDDRPAYEAFRRQVRAGHMAEVEYRLTGLDGVVRWLWTRATVRFEGTRIFVDAITRNITARKLVDIALEEERRRLRQAEAIAGIGSWEWEVDTDLVTWSEPLYQLYGVDSSKFSAAEVNHHVIHPDDRAAMGEEFRRCARTGEPLNHRYRVVRPSDGRVRIFEAHGEPMYGAGVRVLRMAGTAADITDQVRAQRHVAEREALLQAILANRRSLIQVTGPDGQLRPATEARLREAVENGVPVGSA
jgi:PAS domain S-box-containing protein